MSEPSLRTTEPWLTDELVELAAQAIYEYRNYGHFTDPRPNPDAAEHWRHEARCWLAKVGPALALRVLHTQTNPPPVSEPSLRDTTAQAIGRAYWRSQNQPNRAVRASEWYPEADAALSVIHTQRDAIEQAVRVAILRGAAGATNTGYGYNDAALSVQARNVADAVLATLGADEL